MSKYQEALELLQEAVEKAKKYDEKETPPITGNTSDGYHTFNELYEHRTALFAVICNMFPKLSFKSWKHDDGTMFDGMFIAGIKTPKGYYSYHCEKEYFWMFANTPEIEKAPKWDGHKPKDYTRLFELLDWSEENEGQRLDLVL
jgi:hypothetical protein